MSVSKKDFFSFEVFGIRFSGHKKRLLKLVLQVWLALALLLLVSVVFFGYEMTTSDIPGGLISGILLAYLIHIFIE